METETKGNKKKTLRTFEENVTKDVLKTAQSRHYISFLLPPFIKLFLTNE